jgi:hypothetical protein
MLALCLLNDQWDLYDHNPEKSFGKVDLPGLVNFADLSDLSNSSQ